MIQWMKPNIRQLHLAAVAAGFLALSGCFPQTSSGAETEMQAAAPTPIAGSVEASPATPGTYTVSFRDPSEAKPGSTQLFLDTPAVAQFLAVHAEELTKTRVPVSSVHRTEDAFATEMISPRTYRLSRAPFPELDGVEPFGTEGDGLVVEAVNSVRMETPSGEDAQVSPDQCRSGTLEWRYVDPRSHAVFVGYEATYRLTVECRQGVRVVTNVSGG